MLIRLALAAALLLAAPVPAGAQTQQQMNADAQASAKKADARLNAAYRRVMAKLGPAERKALTAAEVKWIAFRDAEAAFRADRYLGGSIAPMIYSGAIEALTTARAIQLEATAPGRFDPAHDKELNRLYQELLRDLPAARRKGLQRAELAWIAFRDAEAAYQARKFGVAKEGPLAELTRLRAQELREAINAGEEAP